MLTRGCCTDANFQFNKNSEVFRGGAQNKIKVTANSRVLNSKIYVFASPWTLIHGTERGEREGGLKYGRPNFVHAPRKERYLWFDHNQISGEIYCLKYTLLPVLHRDLFPYISAGNTLLRTELNVHFDINFERRYFVYS